VATQSLGGGSWLARDPDVKVEYGGNRGCVVVERMRGRRCRNRGDGDVRAAHRVRGAIAGVDLVAWTGSEAGRLILAAVAGSARGRRGCGGRRCGPARRGKASRGGSTRRRRSATGSVQRGPWPRSCASRRGSRGRKSGGGQEERARARAWPGGFIAVALGFQVTALAYVPSDGMAGTTWRASIARAGGAAGNVREGGAGRCVVRVVKVVKGRGLGRARAGIARGHPRASVVASNKRQCIGDEARLYGERRRWRRLRLSDGRETSSAAPSFCCS
jgi:hypothetical protein